MPIKTTQVQIALRDYHQALSRLTKASGKKEQKLCEQNYKITQRNVFREESQNLSDLAFKAKLLQEDGLVAFIACDPEKLTLEQHILWSLVRDIRLLAAHDTHEKIQEPLEDAVGLIGVLQETHDKLDENGRATLLAVITKTMSQLHEQFIECGNANFLPLPPDDKEFADLYTKHTPAHGGRRYPDHRRP